MTEWITTKEYADSKGVSLQAVYKQIKKGKLAGRRNGKGWEVEQPNGFTTNQTNQPVTYETNHETNETSEVTYETNSKIDALERTQIEINRSLAELFTKIDDMPLGENEEIRRLRNQLSDTREMLAELKGTVASGQKQHPRQPRRQILDGQTERDDVSWVGSNGLVCPRFYDKPFDPDKVTSARIRQVLGLAPLRTVKAK